MNREGGREECHSVKYSGSFLAIVHANAGFQVVMLVSLCSKLSLLHRFYSYAQVACKCVG